MRVKTFFIVVITVLVTVILMKNMDEVNFLDLRHQVDSKTSRSGHYVYNWCDRRLPYRKTETEKN